MYKVELLPSAEKSLEKISKSNKQLAKNIYSALEEIEDLDNPRTKGKALTGTLSGLWRYRVQDYRIICSIEDDKLIVVVIKIDHRRDVYRLK